ncbi:GNAT family N-acetyltransferase [Shewanella sp. SW36]|jgi:RimJ/RimL family protein N-acetyltransferase|uniref:GNAT family N-acetyltransferase n=1 Tax=Shewanella TaxID=22 RepID=UPI0018E2D935|nr:MULTISPECIES: GNAT family N-acetyltransferase [unclassified Shewanella]MBI1672960.1 GNAT family N-acetyltransferase [Shewanella sp. DW31]MBP6520769.1 GNAT family N-acetyltransferase [Shewanella sp.]MCU7974733.1 GNAT family N-acetyltransferase [Shewanella sp. SW36]MCU7990121.1 GNAT family N-acetyltransferase [Shewanella sp. SW1]MCU8012850.1 GNAT family N-acetyltransferase [Shewanella sp. SM74]
MSSKSDKQPNTQYSVSLRPIIESDLEAIFVHQSDPIANQLAQFPPRDREAFFKHWHQNILGQVNVLPRAIVVDGKFVGNIGHWQSDGQALIGYWIDREYWGKGIATQTLAQFLPLVSLRPLFAHVAKHNLASQRVLLRHGFVLTDQLIQECEDTEALLEFVLR